MGAGCSDTQAGDNKLNVCSPTSLLVIQSGQLTHHPYNLVFEEMLAQL